MRHARLPLVLATSVLLLTTPATAGDLPATETARYRVTFQATWSQATHPTAWPGGSAHWSGLVGGTHDSSIQFWSPGQLASPGIESMAETGSKFLLLGEVNAAIAANGAEFALSGGGISPSPGSTAFEFDITDSHPYVTLVSMIAPSPDWFVGVDGLSLRANGDWVDDIAVPLLPYDSGTDSGTTFLSTNQNTVPAQPITQITGFPFANGVPLGRFIFERVDDPMPSFPDLGQGLAGGGGVPQLVGTGSLNAGTAVTLELSNAAPNAAATLIIGTSQASLPFLGGTLVPSPDVLIHGLPVDGAGDLTLTGVWPSGVPTGTDFVFQHWIPDAGAAQGYAASNAVCATTP